MQGELRPRESRRKRPVNQLGLFGRWSAEDEGGALAFPLSPAEQSESSVGRNVPQLMSDGQWG